MTAAGASAGQGVAVGVLDTGIAASGDLAGRVAEETGPAGRERADDGPPPGARARRARNPLCRCS